MLNQVDKFFALATVHYQFYIVASAYKPDLKIFVQMYLLDIFRNFSKPAYTHMAEI